MPGYDMSKYQGLEKEKLWVRYGDVISRLTDTSKWNIPDKIVVKAAVTGAFFDRRQNPYQPYTVEEIYRECEECIEAGANSVHIHVRDPQTGIPSGSLEYYRAIIEPLKKKYGSKIIIDSCAQLGETFADKMAPVTEGLLEMSPVNPTVTHIGGTIIGNTPNVVQVQTRIMQEVGCKPEVALYDTGDVENARRWLIDTGILQKPFAWLILPALPGCTPMDNPLAMIEAIGFFVRRIREIDPDGPIMVCAAGRASSYLTVLAILLGLHVRVGMEDTIFRYPHRDDRIASNAKVVASAIAIAREMGREVATADEYREMIGLKQPAQVG